MDEQKFVGIEVTPPAKLIKRPSTDEGDFGVLGWLAAIGLMVGIGQLLASDERLTWRIVVGRALISSALGMSSTVIFLFLPEVPFFVLLGLACGLVSLGTSGLERAFQVIFNRGIR